MRPSVENQATSDMWNRLRHYVPQGHVLLIYLNDNSLDLSAGSEDLENVR